MLHRAHESGTQSQEHERQAAMLAFEQERARQQQVLQAEHQAALQVMQTERYWFPVYTCIPCVIAIAFGCCCKVLPQCIDWQHSRDFAVQALMLEI